ncbi:hypothetical protein [Streptomyces sp. NPDC001970]
MRRASYAAAAVGAVLLLAGCAIEAGPGGAAGKGSGAPAASAPAETSGRPDVDAVAEEIKDAATKAGFTEEFSERGEGKLARCMVTWMADTESPAEDPKAGYRGAVAGLNKGGWKGGRKESRADVKGTYTATSLTKGGWTLHASMRELGSLVMVYFTATDDSCEDAFAEELEKRSPEAPAQP